LLYADILEALVQAGFYANGSRDSATLPANAEELKTRLGQARWSTEKGRVSFDTSNPPFFDEKGDRRSNTGEHVVYLQPLFKGVRNREVLPAATIAVWAWQPMTSNGARGWRPQATLPVHYDGYRESDVESP
jgi:hypothetical protein